MLLEFGKRGVTSLDPFLDGGQGCAQDFFGLECDSEAIIEGQEFDVVGSEAGRQISLDVFPFMDGPPELKVGGFRQGALLAPDVQPPVRPDAGLIGALRSSVAARIGEAASRSRSDRDATRRLLRNHQGSGKAWIFPRSGLLCPGLGLDDTVQRNPDIRIVGERTIDQTLEFTVSEVTPPIHRSFGRRRCQWLRRTGFRGRSGGLPRSGRGRPGTGRILVLSGQGNLGYAVAAWQADAARQCLYTKQGPQPLPAGKVRPV
ncbi:MAG: hypothetical protein CAPSK01_003764 [Candidatus Accumulibacter vicinus]|uniref:Uncharacterized protein n=1 Tax=Candidatus Accumulibacter vicinus TaxID=2954382 RepID=A0A084XWI1_9PROT|nr:MAG: hypothetical protein CAPSK01_003764 [Candidatus Accumulibacter vicinus]